MDSPPSQRLILDSFDRNDQHDHVQNLQSDSRCGKLWQGVERLLIFLHSRLEDADGPEYYWKHKVAEVTEVARFIPQFPRVCPMCHAWAQVNALQRCSSKSSAVV